MSITVHPFRLRRITAVDTTEGAETVEEDGESMTRATDAFVSLKAVDPDEDTSELAVAF